MVLCNHDCREVHNITIMIMHDYSHNPIYCLTPSQNPNIKLPGVWQIGQLGIGFSAVYSYHLLYTYWTEAILS